MRHNYIAKKLICQVESKNARRLFSPGIYLNLISDRQKRLRFSKEIRTSISFG
jgi:hypothetical protein